MFVSMQVAVLVLQAPFPLQMHLSALSVVLAALHPTTFAHGRMLGLRKHGSLKQGGSAHVPSPASSSRR